MALDVNGLLQVGLDILSTTRVGKAILAVTGDVQSAETEADQVEWWQHVGFVSRPPKAEPGKSACQVVTVKGPQYDAAIASRDFRGQDLAGTLNEGETCVYAAGADGKGQARLLLKANGAVALFTRKDNATDGTGLAIQIDPNTDTISLTNSKGYGLLITADGVYVSAGNATLTLAGGDASLVATGRTQVDGSSVVLGSVAVPGVNAALHGPTGPGGVASLKVLIE